MTMGRPVADLDDFLEETPPRLQPAPEPTPTHRVKRSKTPWILAATALVVAVAGVGYWLMNRTDENPTSAAGASGPELTTTVPSGVGGFAELFVAAYLGGNPDDVAAFLPAAPSLDAMTPGAHVARHLATIDVTRVADGYWAATIAADMLELENAGYIAAGLSYFQVGVVDDGGRMVAVALPSRVAAPAIRTTPPRSIQAGDGEPTAEIGALSGDFIEALLTGGRDITRYTIPDSTIAAVRPAPYTAIAITAVSGFSDGSVMVTVDGQATNGAIDTMQYVLRLEDQGGGHRVAEVMAGPPQIDGGQE